MELPGNKQPFRKEIHIIGDSIGMMKSLDE
jgi:hypothetical protein